MIKIDIKKDHLKISGHAMFDDYGNDIVCASVSSIVITSINGILRLDDKAISYDQTKDGLDIKILKHNQVIDTLILNMTSLLKELSKQYKKNIQINEEV
jgi:uncharacterized protein YsxB (DUF464 family)